jgi:hypothetical protein
MRGMYRRSHVDMLPTIWSSGNVRASGLERHPLTGPLAVLTGFVLNSFLI